MGEWHFCHPPNWENDIWSKQGEDLLKSIMKNYTFSYCCNVATNGRQGEKMDKRPSQRGWVDKNDNI
jgi:hypothetical protein